MLHLLLSTLTLADSVTTGPRLMLQGRNAYYVNQRDPLAPSQYQKLPTGSIKAEGWLKKQLELQRDGFSGRLPELSRFLSKENNAWLGATTNPRAGWEEVPYWLRGQTSLAYVLSDKKLQDEVKVWIEGVFKSQRPDGWFGPEANLNTRHGTPDLWPNMLMQGVLQTYYEATGDKRVIDLMTKYVGWLDKLPEEQTIDPKHYWHHHRVADQLASLIWLYNRTGNPSIRRVADKFHRRSSNWSKGIANRHGVNFAQGFRETSAYYVLSKEEGLFDRSYMNHQDFIMHFGQGPGGMYAADENAREGKNDPRQATESCAVVEMMFSGELLFQYSGEGYWADRVEDAAFNWMPAFMTSDLKALRYLTAANHAVSDAPSKSPGLENGGPMYLMDPWDHRCCQHNVGIGWPYFTENLWMATNENGLAAILHSPSTVRAKVGSGVMTTITAQTNYPFEDRITYTVKPDKSVEFPLSLRIPSWTDEATVSVNGKMLDIKPKGMITIRRTWKSGDKVVLTMPQRVIAEPWPERNNGVMVRRGPLAYSLKIKENLVRHGRTDQWPAWEIHPGSDWNYGLLPSLRVTVHPPKPMPDQPWDAEKVPLQLTMKGRKIPEWSLDMYGLVAPLQKSPAMSSEPEEDLTFIPMGAAKLRMTVLPTVSPTGTVWTKPRTAAKPIPATWSHRAWFDSEAALSDKLLPTGSDDEEIPRFTWWDHKGTEEWVAYKFPENRTFQKCRVYWFDDGPRGGCRVPEVWKLQVKIDGQWRDVEADGPYPVKKDAWNEISFKPIGGTEIRLVAKLQKDFSSGILEWEVN